MPIPDEYDFVRYLAAKKTVDDRALNKHVWAMLESALDDVRDLASLRVLEVGAGIGTMVARVMDWGMLTDWHYTAVDADAELVKHGKGRTKKKLDKQINQEWVCAEALEFAGRSESQARYDLLIAHAFLDLVDLGSAVPALLGTLKPGGAFWFTLNYDGLTIFEPIIDPELDAQILRLYDRTMDERVVDGKPSGDSRTGRHLFAHLEGAGAEILAAGSSDWVVYPANGVYAGDEAYFLHFIVHTVEEALKGHAELDTRQLADWAAERHAQVEAGELTYIAHQLDFAGRVPKG